MMKNCQDSELLNKIYQEATMGIKGSELLLEKCEDKKFSGQLQKFVIDYSEIRNEAEAMLREMGETPPEISPHKDSMLWMGVQLNTMMDKTSSHMAEMLIQGSTMGVISATKNLNTMDVSTGPHHLADRLIHLDQHNIETMKQYLQ